ncbi:hypothetical protein V3851_03790 [Paenibacillus sp. M1]|uniref:Uncharacterized protein n=1 Tax=Paenibacillus haidiansis TaxID=1574488 RepID=A0ABU7VMG4_9BACL
MRLALYCDFTVEDIRPLQLVIRPRPGELDLGRNLYLPLAGPFERFEPEQYGDLTGVSVLLEDLILESRNEEKLGIALPNLARRHPEVEIDLLIAQVADVEEVLGYKWGDRLMENLLLE